MKKLAVFAVLFAGITASAAGAVSYEIAVQDGTAAVNASFELYAEDEVNYFTTNWQVGPDATVTTVRDSGGELRRVEALGQDTTGAYSVQGRSLEISTHTGDARQSASVQVRYRYPVEIETWKDGLHVLDMQLPGFPDRFEQFDEEQTYVRVNVTEPVLGLAESFGFRSSFHGRTATFQGEGPVNVRVTYTDRDGEYDNFILFGEGNLTRADEVYPLAHHVTGRQTSFRKLPIIVLNRSTYTEHLDAWSAGRYRRGGLIFIRKERVTENDFTGLVMHEVMHAFNARPLHWVQTDAAMFDEGTAKYVEYLVNEKMSVRQPEIFGEEVTWTAPCSDSDRSCRYSLEPRGTPDDLWNYYQQERDFMHGWSPSDDGTVRDGLSLRTFGYAYAELLIRNFVRQEGSEALHTVYDQLADVDEPAKTGSTYASTLEQVMDTGLEPCRDLTKKAVTQCLDRNHGFMPEIPDDVVIDGRTANITFRRVDVPTATGTSENGNTSLEIVPTNGTGQARGFVEGFLSFLADTARNLINAVRTMIQ